jgi:hypothetical protein
VRHAFSLVAGLCLVVPASAVPVSKGGSGQLRPLSVKYLPDDADAVAVVNVRQVLAAPAFQKTFAKQVGELLRDVRVAAPLKDLGVDPMKDIDRICVAMGRSGIYEKGAGVGPYFLVQGRFDPRLLEAGAKKLAKATFDHGSAKIYELSVPFFAAALDKNHVVIAQRKEQVQAALDKATGKKKTVLKNKALAGMLAGLKPEDSLSVVATGETITGGGVSSRSENGKTVTTRTLHTLAESGINALTVVGNIKDSVHVTVTITSKDVDKAKEIEKAVTDGIQQTIPRVQKVLPELARALKTVKIVRAERNVTMKGHGPAEAIQQFITGWFNVRSEENAPADRGVKEKR